MKNEILVILPAKNLENFCKRNKLTLEGIAVIMGMSTHSWMHIVAHEKGRKELNKVVYWRNLASWCKDNKIELR